MNQPSGTVADDGPVDRTSLRLAATLMLVGQLLYIVVTTLHAGGNANDHPAVFAVYASNRIWTAVHLGQFAAMTMLLAGLFALYFVVNSQAGASRWFGRFGVASAAVGLALYGVLQAVDGVTLKQAVNAWASAPDAEKSPRFVSAETVRWLEWGLRSYHNFVLGLAVLLFAAAVIRTIWLPRPIGYLMGLAGLTYLVQGWVVGTEGFSPAETVTIVLAFVLDLVWMIWLAVVAWRTGGSSAAQGGRPAASVSEQRVPHPDRG